MRILRFHLPGLVALATLLPVRRFSLCFGRGLGAGHIGFFFAPGLLPVPCPQQLFGGPGTADLTIPLAAAPACSCPAEQHVCS